MSTRLMNSLRSGHWPSLTAAWLHFEVSFMVWLLIAALGVSIAEEFALSATQKGILVAVPLLAGALLRIPVGICSDVVGIKTTGLILLGGEALALLGGWRGAGSFGEMLAVGLLLGVAGASFAVALPLASRAYPPAHQGLAMGVAASANSGTVLAVFLAPRLAQVAGWHAVFGWMLAPVVIVGLLFAWSVRPDLGSPGVERGSDWRGMLRALVKLPSVWWLCLAYAVTFGGFVGFCSYLPMFLHDQYGLGLVSAGSWAALCGLAGSLVRPVGGYVADRLGGLSVLLWLFPLLAVLTLAIAQLPSWLVAAPLLVTALATMGFGNGVVFQVVSERLSKQIGMASGLIGAAGGFGGVLIPVWLGSLKDLTGTYGAGFLIYGALALVASGTVIVARQRSRRRGIIQD